MDDGAALGVRPLGCRGRHAHRYAVTDGDDLLATVEVGPRRTLLASSGAIPCHEGGADLPPAAWPDRSACRAARDRAADRHEAIATVQRLDLVDGAGHRARAVLDALGSVLEETGARRLDLRARAGDPVVDWLRGGGWMHGQVDGTTLASRSLGYPWTRPSAPADRRAWGPASVRRLGRRISGMQPAQIPELGRIAAAEVAAAVRLRYAPGSPRRQPVAGAPPGTFPFQVTRYRTIRLAFGLLPPALRSTRLVDIGCGDGRVLLEAIDQGWSSVHGRELDPEVAARAAEVVGGHGTVEVGDGLVAPIPDDAGVVFLNNPFQAEGVARLASLLGASLARNRRPLAVIYINPRTVEPLQAEGFALVQCSPAYSLLTFASP